MIMVLASVFHDIIKDYFKRAKAKTTRTLAHKRKQRNDTLKSHTWSRTQIKGIVIYVSRQQCRYHDSVLEFTNNLDT